MEPASQPESVSSKQILEDQLRDCFGRVVYTHKTQEKCADVLIKRQEVLKIVQIILSVLTTGGATSTIVGTGVIGASITAIISGLLLVINSYSKSKDFGMEAQKHRQSAANIWLIREKYLSLITDIHINNKNITEISEERDKLLDALHKVYLGSPSTNFRAYSLAKKALQKNEEMTFSNEEIDAFLPDVLKKKLKQNPES